MVFNVAYRILGSVEDAEDAAQEVFIECMLSFQGFAVMRSSLFSSTALLQMFAGVSGRNRAGIPLL